MVDLYLSLGVMLTLCSLAAFAGASLQQRAGRAMVMIAELLVCLATVAYLNFLWDRPSLSRLLPFSRSAIRVLAEAKRALLIVRASAIAEIGRAHV